MTKPPAIPMALRGRYRHCSPPVFRDVVSGEDIWLSQDGSFVYTQRHCSMIGKENPERWILEEVKRMICPTCNQNVDICWVSKSGQHKCARCCEAEMNEPRIFTTCCLLLGGAFILALLMKVLNL